MLVWCARWAANPRILLGSLLVGAALSCSSKEHPPFIDPGAQSNPGSSGAGADTSVEPPAGGGDSGDLANDSAGDGGSGTSDSPPSTEGTTPGLKSGQVYWSGLFAKAATGFATVDDPLHYTLGVEVATSFAIGENTIWYHHPDEPVFEFTPDVSGPPAPQGTFYPQKYPDNDVIMETKACPGVRGDDSGTPSSGPKQFLVNANGRLVYQCSDLKWYEGDRNVFGTTGTLLALGQGDIALSSLGLVNLSDGSQIPVQAQQGLATAVRAAGDGFDIAKASVCEEGSLIHIDAAGASTSLGMYPALPKGYLCFSGALAADHTLYVFGESADQVLVIFRRPLDSAGEIIYTEKDSALLRIESGDDDFPPSVLFSAP